MKDKLKSFRLSKGWSQAEFARRLGLSAVAIRKWESGERKPGARSIRDLKAMGCEV